MKDDNKELLAFEIALGLVEKADIAHLQESDEFSQYLIYWQKKLKYFPKNQVFSQSKSHQIWQQIKHSIEQDKVLQQHPKTPEITQLKQIKNIWLKLSQLNWLEQYALPAFSLATGLMITLGVFFIQTPQLQANELDWDIIINKQEKILNITATRHQHTNDKTACVLWVKKDNQYQYLGLLPETSHKNLVINKQALAMINQGEIIISAELHSLLNTNTMTSPSKILFADYW